MASGRPIATWLKLLLELGPVVVFFAGYLALRERSFTIAGAEYSGFIIVTAGFVPILLASTAALWALTGTLSRMQIVTAVLVIFFGGLTVALNDEAFFKMKPTIIYALFAGVLGFGLLRGRSYLAALMDSALPLTPEGWLILTRRLAFFFVGLAVANEAVWRLMSTDAWVNFKTFGLTGALFAFFMAQGRLISAHSRDGAEG